MKKFIRNTFGVPSSDFWRIARRFLRGDKYGAILEAKMCGYRLLAQKLQQRVDC